MIPTLAICHRYPHMSPALPACRLVSTYASAARSPCISPALAYVTQSSHTLPALTIGQRPSPHLLAHSFAYSFTCSSTRLHVPSSPFEVVQLFAREFVSSFICLLVH